MTFKPVTRYLRAGGLALLAGLALVLALTHNPLVRQTEDSVEKVAASAVIVYASLRAINAALSTAQEVAVGGSLGVQANLQPFKVLEPVDDTVERVADVVFAVAIGAAVVAVGLAPVAALGAWLLATGLLVSALSTLWPDAPARLRRLAWPATRLGGAVSLALPLVVTLGLELGERMTTGPAEEARAVLNSVAEKAGLLIGRDSGLPDMAGGADPAEGFFGRLAAMGDAVQDYAEAAGVFLNEADALFKAMLTLIGVFVLQSLVLPILLFWGGWVLLKRGTS